MDITIYDKVGRSDTYSINNTRVLEKTIPNDLETLSSNFFNTLGIKDALELLSPRILENSNDEIAVYFNEIQGFDIKYIGEDKIRWWFPLEQCLVPGMNNVPTGLNKEYFYNPDENVKVTSEFLNDDKEPYQIFIKMFNNSLRAFSCFIGEDNPEISFSSGNYDGDDSYKRLGQTDKLPWYGTLEDFLSTTEKLEQTILKMEKPGYVIGWNNHISSTHKIEVNLIHPTYGMIIMRPIQQEVHGYINNPVSKLKWGSWKLPKTIILPGDIMKEFIAA